MIAITAEQMQRVDEMAVDKYRILLVQMMELAGFHLASLTKKKLGGCVEGKQIVILAGKGNNGGGGLVAARVLCNWGGDIEVILSQTEGMNDTVKGRLMTLHAMPVKISTFRMQNELIQRARVAHP